MSACARDARRAPQACCRATGVPGGRRQGGGAARCLHAAPRRSAARVSCAASSSNYADYAGRMVGASSAAANPPPARCRHRLPCVVCICLGGSRCSTQVDSLGFAHAPATGLCTTERRRPRLPPPLQRCRGTPSILQPAARRCSCRSCGAQSLGAAAWWPSSPTLLTSAPRNWPRSCWRYCLRCAGADSLPAQLISSVGANESAVSAVAALPRPPATSPAPHSAVPVLPSPQNNRPSSCKLQAWVFLRWAWGSRRRAAALLSSPAFPLTCCMPVRWVGGGGWR